MEVIFTQFHTHFLNSLKKHAPLRKATRVEKKILLKLWLTSGIVKSIKVWDQIYKKFLKSKDSLFHDRYRFYHNKIRKLITLSRTKYYKHYFNTHQNNAKLVWAGVREVIGQQNRLDTNIIIQDRGKVVSDQKTVANKFCNFFPILL